MLVALAGATLQRAKAAALASQAAANYITKPGPGGSHCAACQFFVAGTANAAGTCMAVAGSISPNGYCSYFTAKN